MPLASRLPATADMDHILYELAVDVAKRSSRRAEWQGVVSAGNPICKLCEYSDAQICDH